MQKAIGKKAVIIISQKDYSEEELTKTKAVLDQAGVKTTVASTNIKQARGNRGGSFMPDMLVQDIKVADYDAIVFIGGNGAQQYFNDSAAHAIAKEAVKLKKVLAAICIAPVTLGNAGVLMGKKATVWPSERQAIMDNAANYTGKHVESDGDVVTADGPQSSTGFGEEIVNKLNQ